MFCHALAGITCTFTLAIKQPNLRTVCGAPSMAELLMQHGAGSLPSPHQDFPASESIEVFASLDWTSLATEIASQIKNMGCVALVFSQNMRSFLTKARLDFVFWQGCQANSPLADRRSRRGRRHFATRLPASPAHSP